MDSPLLFVAAWLGCVAVLGFALTVAGLAGGWMGLARVGILIAACAAFVFIAWLLIAAAVIVGGSHG